MQEKQFDNARPLYEEALRVREKLRAQDPENADALQDLSVPYEKIGLPEAARENMPAALPPFEPSAEIAEQLAAKDPANAEWQRDVIVTLEQIAQVREAIGDLQGADRELREEPRHRHAARRGGPTERLSAAGFVCHLQRAWRMRE